MVYLRSQDNQKKPERNNLKIVNAHAFVQCVSPNPFLFQPVFESQPY
jgi:hypothetical protein